MTGDDLDADSWFATNLGDAMLAGDALDHIKRLLVRESGGTQGAPEMAVFLRHESEGRLHCEVKVYFPPAAAVVAAAVDAVPCGRPDPGGLGLLAGSEASWSALFPERCEPQEGP